MFCFRLRWFDFHKIVSLYPSDCDSDYDSLASENQPLGAALCMALFPFLPEEMRKNCHHKENKTGGKMKKM